MPRVASEAMKPIRTWSARKLAKRARLPIHARQPKAIDSRRRLRLGRPRPLNRAQLQKTKSARTQSPRAQAIAARDTVTPPPAESASGAAAYTEHDLAD